MAKSGAVWGIDIGQCALKALRCRAHEKDSNRIVVEAFDYVEYSKILSQPEADREELIREALEQFLSRNDVKGDSIAISVPGQSGLARFIKLPPVEKKKIPDIVKYEARQQIPFALEDVVWDYQPLVGTSEDEGYALDTEVGLFAMKRDQVTRAMRPLEEAGIDVDYIQLSPLAIYNFVCFDRLNNLEDAEPYNPASPPPSIIVISLGTETTDLVITNGYRVWQRNVPIGGNHFTKALTKELRLTFSKAEHLKRNAMKAEDPKAVFQAMRPVFSDLVAEIQRSLGFFTSNNRGARLGDVVVLGNAIKLPGLQRYLSQNLEHNVVPVTEFEKLVGGTATAQPQFKENQLSFAVAYGLCVQALGLSRISTNLLPEEIVTTRLVRAKKPWTVAAAAVLLLGMAVNYGSHYRSWKSADTSQETNPAMYRALENSKSWAQTAGNWESTNSSLRSQFEQIVQIGKNLQSNVDGRLLWLELLNAVDEALPKDDRPLDERKETAEDVTSRAELHIEHLDCEYFDDLSTWFANVQTAYTQSREELADDAEPPQPADPAAPDAAAPDADADAVAEPAEAPPTDEATGFADQGFAGDAFADPAAAGAPAGPTGPGWVIQLNGYHFHNPVPADPQNEGKEFVDNTLVEQLENGTVMLPDGPNGEMMEVSMEELGISYPIVITKNPIYEVQYTPQTLSEMEMTRRRSMGVEDTRGSTRGTRGRPRAARNAEEEIKPPEVWTLREYDFVVQFVWQPMPRSERIAKRQAPEDGAGGEGAVDEFDTAAADRTRL
jgi:type IV pilus assembly protein PilM